MPEAGEGNVESVVARLHRAVTADPYVLPDGTSIRLGVSMGMAIGPLTPETAVLADQSLLDAKRHGKNRVGGMPGGELTDATDASRHASRLGWLADACRVLWEQWATAAVLTDSDGRIIAVNAAYEKLTGRSWDELAMQKPGINSFGDTPLDTYRELWGSLLAGRAWHGRLKNRRPNGEVWWAEERIVPIRVGSQVMGYWGVVSEVTPSALDGAGFGIPARANDGRPSAQAGGAPHQPAADPGRRG